MTTILFAGLSALALLANRVFKIDTDAGGYPDVWYPAKQAKHFAAAFAIACLAVLLGVPWPWALGITVADGVLFEVTQGFVNRHDIYADCIGALLGTGLGVLL